MMMTPPSAFWNANKTSVSKKLFSIFSRLFSVLRKSFPTIWLKPNGIDNDIPLKPCDEDSKDPSYLNSKL